MSLLVVNSASKISQGIVKHLHKSGKFESINCADLYPNYWGIQSQVNFLGGLEKSSKTKVHDTHIQERSDLQKAVDNATHVLYITHDYYTNVSAKTNLIQTVAQLVKDKKSIKSFVAVTPNEHDHYAESDPVNSAIESEKKAKQISEILTLIKSDLTFGKDSTVLSMLVNHLQQSKNITVQSSSGGPAPIHTNCVAHGVETALKGGHNGQSFLAEGAKRLSWQDVINTLEKATGAHKQVNSSNLEWAFSPLSNNLGSEFLFQDTYRNAVQYINQHKPVAADGAKPITELGVKPIDFDTHYSAGSIKRVDQHDKPDQADQQIKQFLY